MYDTMVQMERGERFPFEYEQITYMRSIRKQKNEFKKKIINEEKMYESDDDTLVENQDYGEDISFMFEFDDEEDEEGEGEEGGGGGEKKKKDDDDDWAYLIHSESLENIFNPFTLKWTPSAKSPPLTGKNHRQPNSPNTYSTF